MRNSSNKLDRPGTAKVAMNTNAASGPQPQTSDRLVSLDVFRGLVIVVMTIVNYLSPVHGVPAWAKHRPGDLEGYTFVDVVFPAFLFMVGVAIPFALQRRLDRGDSPFALGGKIVFRSAALIFLGVITLNPMFYSNEWSLLPKDLWFFLTLLCACAAWISVPPKISPDGKMKYRIVQWIGLIGLLILLALFRARSSAGQMVWLRHSWWGMLGQIGWAYLTASLCWLLLRKYSLALFCMMWFMLAFYIADRHDGLTWIGPSVRQWLNIGPLFGTNPATVIMGILAGTCLQQKRSGVSVALLGLGLYIVGDIVRPLHGINKSAHTESYALVTGGISCLVFAAVYFAVDVKRWNCAQPFLVPIGQNALLAYLLPDMLKHAFAACGLDTYWSRNSTEGIASAFFLTAIILLIVWTLTRLRIVLRL